MAQQIRSAAVIGSGVMGSGIAAHLANAGIRCLMLDRVPLQLTDAEAAQGLTLHSPAVRNRLANKALERLKKSKPPLLYDLSFLSRVTTGNIEDHLDHIAEVDWVIEAVVEHLPTKQELFENIERVWKPGTVVSTNTSGLSVNKMVEGRSELFCAHFLGTHFFNPPRYMKLVEVVPAQATKPEVLRSVMQVCQKVLGKGIVIAKDTPNFIANRIGTYGLLVTLQEMERGGYTVEEIDAVTGPAMCRPKSATFRTLDLVGIDTFVHVAGNVFNSINDLHEKASFEVPDVLKRLVEQGWTGEKSGQGFYKKIKWNTGSVIWVLDAERMEYRERKKVASRSLEAAKMAKGAAKINVLLEGQDRYAECAWNILKRVLIYSAEKVGEIADSIVEIDKAMKWGFNWELGPFETWDEIGLIASVKRMEADGLKVPAWVKAWIAEGHDRFYQQQKGDAYFSHQMALQKIMFAEEVLSLQGLKQKNQVIHKNPGASLIDLGDGVACLELHSPQNAIGADILQMIRKSVDEVERNYEGLVIASEGKHFCVGANLMLILMEAQDEEWDEIDRIIKLFQDSMRLLKYCRKPVVAAPHHMTLGGGVELCLPADLVCASAETYYGLVEAGVGLIPAGGGCKEMALRASLAANHAAHTPLQPAMNQYFELIGMAKVSSSAHDAKRLGLMKPNDRIVMREESLIYEAKQEVLHLAKQEYQPHEETNIKVVGKDGKAVMQLGAYDLRQGSFISDYDQMIADKLAHVLAGGNVPAGAEVSERYLLDLEREAFLSLCGEPKTQARMQHMLTKGKPLRN